MPFRNRLRGRTKNGTKVSLTGDVHDGGIWLRSQGSRKGEKGKGMTYIIPMQFLVLVQLTIVFIDPRSEAVGITTKGDIQVLQEFIAACE